MNSYFIVLIPKYQAKASFNDFRPISLLNFSYKISMASRLATILLDLVSPHQAAIVQGRSIHEQIALGHELMQRIRRKMAGGSFGLKLDISIALDSIN